MPKLSERRPALDFFYFWLWRGPLYFSILLQRTLSKINQELAIGLMLRMLFVPLFGDGGPIGRVIGFVFRSVRIIIGIVAIAVTFLIFVILFLMWLTFPLWLFLFLRLYAVPVLAVLVAVYYLYEYPRPLRKLTELKPYESPLLTAPLKLKQALHSDRYLEQLLGLGEVKDFIRRLGVGEAEFRQALLTIDHHLINQDELLKFAVKEGLTRKVKYLEPPLVFYAVLRVTPLFDNILTQFELTAKLLAGTLDLMIYREKTLNPPDFFGEDYVAAPMGGVNRGWTARPTPVLDQYSEDLTREATKGLLPRPIGKDKVLNDIVQVLARRTRQNVLLVGEPGCGKTSAVKGIAYKIVEGTNDGPLKFKRLVALDVGSLTGGAQSTGELNGRLATIINEIKASRNIILFVDEVHNLSSTMSSDPNASSIFSVLEPHLSAGELEFIGATTKQNYKKYIEPNEAFARVLEKVEMVEATPAETLEILKYVALEFETSHKVVISYPAIDATIELSKKLIHDRVLPDKAVDILENACVEAQSDNASLSSRTSASRDPGSRKVVTKAEVDAVLTKLTKIPVAKISEDESKKLLNLESSLHDRVIGQNEAVTAITNAMQRARVGLRDEGKPISSFLFAGPTGVGKTETAKALAAIYFGDEKLMLRFDMSEYMEAASVERLMDRLADGVRQKPFALVLIDEIEKAHPNISLLFLQILDDGRLTDQSGRTVDFTNTIIIATSNVGSTEIQDAVRENVPLAELKKRQMAALLNRFAPEFLNRFSGLITFAPLTGEQIAQIVKLKLAKVSKQLAGKLITVTFSDDLISTLATQGFDPQWGARPLNRLIADKLETKLAQEILEGKLKKGDSLTIDKDFIL